MIFFRSNFLSKIASFFFIVLTTFILSFIIFISFKPIKVNIFDTNFDFLELENNKLIEVGSSYLSFNKSSKNFEILIENFKSEKIIIPDLLLALDFKTIFSGSLTPNIIKIYDANIKLDLSNNFKKKNVEDILKEILNIIYSNLIGTNEENAFLSKFNILEINNSTMSIVKSKDISLNFYPIDFKINNQNKDLEVSGLISQIDEKLKRNISFSIKRNLSNYDGKLIVNRFDLDQFQNFFNSQLFSINMLEITGKTFFKIDNFFELISLESKYDFKGEITGDFQSKHNILQIKHGNFKTNYSRANKLLSSNIKLNSNSTEFNIDLFSKDDNKIIELNVDKISLSNLEKYWPIDFKKSTRSWVKKNISGNISNLFLKFNIKRDFSVENLNGSFKFESTMLNYLDSMPRIFDLNGLAYIFSDHLEFDISSGYSRKLNLLNGKIKIVDLDKDIERAIIDLNVNTNTNDLNSYLKLSPINNENFKKLENIKANTNIKLNLELPLLLDLPIEEIIYNAKLETNNATIYNIFESLDIENANIVASINQNNVIYSGEGLVNNFLLKFESNEDLSSSNENLQLDLEIQPNFLNNFFPGLIQDSKGSMLVDILINQNKKNKDSKILGTVSLSKFEAFSKLLNLKHNYEEGELLFEVKNNENKKKIDFSFKTDVNDIHANFLFYDNILEEIKIDKFKTPTQDFKSFIKNTGKYFISNFEGNKIDISNFVDVRNEYNNTNFNLQFNFEVDKILLSGRLINDPILRGKFKDNSFDFLIFEINEDDKKHSIRIDEPSKTLDIYSNDASDLIKYFYEESNFQKGFLKINATKMDKKYQGTIQIEKFVSIDAPFFTKVLSFFSIEGLEQQLKGGGVFFDKLKTNYYYEDETLFLENGLVRGSDIGLTFGGRYDLNDDETNINGTFIPAYTLNTLLTNLPLLGDIISAGQPEEGVIAATFNIRKINKKTEISFNPISVIVPSIIRNLLDFTEKEKVD